MKYFCSLQGKCCTYLLNTAFKKANASLILLIIFYLFINSCSTSDKENEIATNITPIAFDSCKSVEYGDSLVLGIRTMMTRKEYNEYIGCLINTNKLEVDSTLRLGIPYSDFNKEVQSCSFKLIPTFEDCYLIIMTLKNENSTPSRILEVFEKKYVTNLQPPSKARLPVKTDFSNEINPDNPFSEEDFIEVGKKSRDYMGNSKVVNNTTDEESEIKKYHFEDIEKYWITDKNKITLKGSIINYESDLFWGVEIIYQSNKIINQKELLDHTNKELKKEKGEKAINKIKDIL